MGRALRVGRAGRAGGLGRRGRDSIILRGPGFGKTSKSAAGSDLPIGCPSRSGRFLRTTSGRPEAPGSPGPPATAASSRPPRRRRPAAESENGAGPIYDDTHTIFGNSADRPRHDGPARPLRRVPARPGSLGAGWGPVSGSSERPSPTSTRVQESAGTFMGWGDPPEGHDCSLGAAERVEPGPGAALRTFPNEAAPSLHARVRSAPRGAGLASLGAADWLRSAPRIGFARRGDWLRSARGIGFARRRGEAPVPHEGPGSPGRNRGPKSLPNKLQ